MNLPTNPWWVTLACVGATLILTEGSIFEWLRKRLWFFGCPQCVGFWVGMIGGFLAGFPALLAFGHGCSVSLLAMIVDAGLTRLSRP